ncbi:hypothetical protein ALI22I_04645 [Saccharothrix sp. ALI-22-I]|nr:hypothetical protein ALI22I_04645 [Saccharothrix sp. ALI-22-I]
MMLECVALPVAERSRFSVNAIRQAEQFLEIEPDTFASFFAVDIEPDNRERKKALRELLVEVRDSIQDAPVDAMSPTRPLFWVPAVLRIGSAVLVATVVGAPLAALAVGESVVVEVTKAGITVTACAIAAELTNRVLERWLTPPGPAEPIASYNSHDHPRPPHEPNDDGVHDLNSRTPDELVTEGPASPAFDEPSVLLSEDLVVKSPDWLDLNDLSPSVLDELLLEDLEQPTVDDLAERQVELFEPVDEEGLQPDPPAPVDLDEPLRSKIDDPYDDFDL